MEEKKSKTFDLQASRAKRFIVYTFVTFLSLIWLSFYLYQFIPYWAKIPFIITSSVVIGLPAVIIILMLGAYMADKIQ